MGSENSNRKENIMKERIWMLFLLIASVSVFSVIAVAEESSGSSASDLAKAVQNPVADLISLPFQWNSYFETGPKNKTQNVLLIQPVVPISLNEEFNFIARPIFPLIEQPPNTDDQNRNYGLGNIQFQGFFSPKEPTASGWITGFGPYLEFPTNSGPDGRFGSDNWSAGPAFVALKIDGPWVYGALISHLWSYYGNDPEVNLTTIQPFLNYNMPDGWYLSASPSMTSNWSADSNDQWTIPVGGGIGKVFMLGKQPVNAQVKAYYNVEKPEYGPDWQLQFQLQLMFPK
jgi:hypothetical protein